MSNDDWRKLQGPWERVRWARRYWQNTTKHPESAADAARALGMKEGTYRAYERPPDASKATKLDFEKATTFGRKYKVNRTWLLEASGSPFDQDQPLSQEQILQMLSTPDVQRLLAGPIAELLTNLTSSKKDE